MLLLSLLAISNSKNRQSIDWDRAKDLQEVQVIGCGEVKGGEGHNRFDQF